MDNLNRVEALRRVEQMLQDGRQHIITTPNPEFIVAAQKDAEFLAILNRADLALPDGAGLIWAARVLGTPLRERIAGSDFVWDIAGLAAERGYTIYLLGGRGEVAKAAAEKLKIKNVKLKIIGDPGPPFCILHSTFCIENIRTAAPDILLVALGHPKQEKWIAEHLTELPSVKIAMGVGGALDFIAGRVSRAPGFMRGLGLEWLWRLMLQPWRILRIFRAVIVFPALIVTQYLTKDRK